MAYEVVRDDGYSAAKLALHAFLNAGLMIYLLALVISLH